MRQTRVQRQPALMFSRSVPQSMKLRTADSHELYCQMCGVSTWDRDEFTGKPARFRAALVPNNGLSFQSRIPNLRVLCSTCNQGAKNVTGEKPTSIWLLSQI